jgi:hypothetical protein
MQEIKIYETFFGVASGVPTVSETVSLSAQVRSRMQFTAPALLLGKSVASSKFCHGPLPLPTYTAVADCGFGSIVAVKSTFLLAQPVVTSM